MTASDDGITDLCSGSMQDNILIHMYPHNLNNNLAVTMPLFFRETLGVDIDFIRTHRNVPGHNMTENLCPYRQNYPTDKNKTKYLIHRNQKQNRYTEATTFYRGLNIFLLNCTNTTLCKVDPRQHSFGKRLYLQRGGSNHHNCMMHTSADAIC